MLKTEKPREVQEIKNLASSYSVVGVLNMRKLPARQLQKIRHALAGTAVIRMSRKSLVKRAIEDESLREKMDGVVPAMIFTNENPFRLYQKLKESRMPAPAKKGDIATRDIVIPAGPTPLAPGPAISALQKVGLKTSVQGGKIAVMQDKVVCKAGQEISDDVANVLGMLKIEPLEVGLELVAAKEKGLVYEKDVLDIDIDGYVQNLQASAGAAFNLSLNTGYLTGETAPFAIQKAFSEARSLSVEFGIIEKEFIDALMAKAAVEAKALQNIAKIEQ